MYWTESWIKEPAQVLASSESHVKETMTLNVHGTAAEVGGYGATETQASAQREAARVVSNMTYVLCQGPINNSVCVSGLSGQLNIIQHFIDGNTVKLTWKLDLEPKPGLRKFILNHDSA